MPQSRQSRRTRTEGRTEFELKRPEWQQFNTKAFQYYSNKKCFRFYQNQTGVQKGSIRGTQKLPISRKTATFSPQLGETNSGPMGPTNSEGCSNRIYKHTSPILFPIPTQSVRERQGIITGGDHLHDGEGSNSGAITRRNPHGFLFHNVSGPQERWENETSDQPKAVEPVCTGTSFQNGRHSDSQRTSPAKRLVNEDRPKGCLFYDTNSQGTPEISQVQGGASLLPVHMPTVRSVERSLGLYQDPEASGSKTQRVWDSNGCLPGRYSGNSEQSTRSSRPHLCTNLHSRTSGICCSPRKVNDPAHPEGEVPGNGCRLDVHGTASSRIEDKEDQDRSEEHSAIEQCISERYNSPDRQDDLGHSSHSTSSTVLQKPPEERFSGISSLAGQPRIFLCGWEIQSLAKINTKSCDNALYSAVQSDSTARNYHMTFGGKDAMTTRSCIYRVH